MPGGKAARVAISVALLLGVTTTVGWSWDSKAIAAVRSDLFFASLGLVVVLLLGGVVLSSLRLKLITADIGYRLTFRDAAMTLGVGQLAGTAFFQLAGQLIGRSAVLSRKGIPPAATVVISGYERAVALSVSLVLAGAGAVYLFGSLSFSAQSGGLSLIKLALGLVAAIASGALFAWGGPISGYARKVTPDLLYKLLRSFLISLAIQGTTLAAYVALEIVLAPHIGIPSLIAASCIIMLAASLPISFGGWGLRELSAVVALQAIGLPSSSALLIAVLIGVLSIAVIVGTVVTVMVTGATEPSARTPLPVTGTADYSKSLDWLLPPVAATAVFFQVYLPTGGGPISVNLADPVVLLGASLFALHHIGKRWPVWRVPHVGAWVAAATAVIFFAILRGWASFGWTDWAFVNKGLGWPMLLCYGATGALLIHRAQQRGLDLLLSTFAATGAAIVLIEVGLIVLVSLGANELRTLIEARVAGLSQNPNAFAFVLVMMLSAAIVQNKRWGVRIGFMVAALVGIWFSGSLAGLLAVPAIFAAALAMRVALRPLVVASLAAVTIIASVRVLPHLIDSQSMLDAALMLHGRPDEVLFQHWQTILDGLAMFIAHPIFGAGIGAYMDAQVRSTGMPLVIHSTPVWLLAETGLLGFGVFLAAAWRLFSSEIRRRGDPAALLLVLILCGLAVMSSFHELLYQRGFWLLLGAVLAMPVVAVRDGRGN